MIRLASGRTRRAEVHRYEAHGVGKRGYLRVVDESGEDYLYPAKCFAAIELPKAAAKALAVPA
jgi:hypothetical protein